MIPVEVTESVAVVTIPKYAEKSVEASVHIRDKRRHKSVVNFEPCLAPVRFADTMIVYGKDSTRKRYISRTFYEPRVKPRKFSETDFVYPKGKTERFASFLDYHIDECRKWYKTCMELKAKSVTVHAIPSGSTSSTTTVTSSQSRRDVTDDVSFDGPGASQVFIPPPREGDLEFEERQFRVGLKKDKVDINMNGPLINGF